MRNRVAMTDMAALMKGTEADIESVVTRAMRDGTDLMKEDWRDQIEAAGLGRRLALSIRGATYPSGGRTSLEPVSWVHTTAGGIIDAFDRGATITPTAGRRFLAIPTQDCPRHRQGNALKPREVEARFGRRLQFIDPNDRGFWTPSIRRPGVAYLVLKNLVVRKATGRWRNPSAREMTRGRAGKRALSHVVMFILVPQVRVKKRLDINAIAFRGQNRVLPLIDRHWPYIPDRTAPMRER